MKRPNTPSVSIEERLEQLKEKYNPMGQSIDAYLEGLLYSKYLSYWDYIHLDTLLPLQTPRTDIPDENIFILYHQITELYLKGILMEMEQMSALGSEITAKFFLERLGRIVRYFRQLVSSFDMMMDGMDFKQFLQFRMALLPASGFQSAQFRKIEIWATDFLNIVNKENRKDFEVSSEISKMFEYLYWKQGATEAATGDKTLTLVQFETKYNAELLALAESRRDSNLWQIFATYIPKEDPLVSKIKDEMKRFDALVNVDWALAHYKTAVRYLQKKSMMVSATGGTNWQEYLPPKFQRVNFFPELWTEEEKEEWGKRWVEQNIGNRK